MIKFWAVMYQHKNMIGFDSYGAASAAVAEGMFWSQHNHRNFKVCRVIPCGTSMTKATWLKSIGETEMK